MKSLALVCLSMLLAGGALAADNGLPEKKVATFNAAYSPLGFDSNDNVQIVGEGVFPNTCYRPAPPTVRVDQSKKTITIEANSYKYSGMCLQVLVPFDRVIDLGILRPGTYTVLRANDGSKLETVTVKRATSRSPDDFVYAPISQAFVHKVGSNHELTITGEFTTSCMVLDEVKVDIQSKVIVVQPIARLENRDDCSQTKVPFTKTVLLENISAGRYLLHVRSMNAKAVNNLIDIE